MKNKSRYFAKEQLSKIHTPKSKFGILSITLTILTSSILITGSNTNSYAQEELCLATLSDSDWKQGQPPLAYTELANGNVGLNEMSVTLNNPQDLSTVALGPFTPSISPIDPVEQPPYESLLFYPSNTSVLARLNSNQEISSPESDPAYGGIIMVNQTPILNTGPYIEQYWLKQERKNLNDGAYSNKFALWDLSSTATERNISANVNYNYSGLKNQCTSRKISIPINIPVKVPIYRPAETNILKLNGITTVEKSKISPIPISTNQHEFNGQYLANYYENNLVEDSKDLYPFFISEDRCITNAQGNVFVNVTDAQSFLKLKGSVCKVKAIWMNLDALTAQDGIAYYSDAWVQSPKSNNKSALQPQKRIICINKKIIKKVNGSNPKCPAGFKQKN